jgi:hypothetical protein
VVDITLEDVEIAIKILEEFLRRIEKSRRVLMKLGRYAGVGTGGPRDLLGQIMVMSMQQAQKKAEATSEESFEEELTEEELNRLRKIAEEIRKES